MSAAITEAERALLLAGIEHAKFYELHSGSTPTEEALYAAWRQLQLAREAAAAKRDPATCQSQHRHIGEPMPNCVVCGGTGRVPQMVKP